MAKALTKMQLTHLSGALKRAISVKVENVKKNFEAFSLPRISVEQKLELIFAGKAERLPQNEIDGYTDFHAAYTTTQERELAKANKVIEVFKKACEKESASIYEKAVFLGAEEAFALLKKFQGE